MLLVEGPAEGIPATGDSSGKGSIGARGSGKVSNCSGSKNLQRWSFTEALMLLNHGSHVAWLMRTTSLTTFVEVEVMADRRKGIEVPGKLCELNMAHEVSARDRREG